MTSRVIAVTGASGGAGCTTLTLHLAGALGGVAVDGRPLGNALELAGIELDDGLRWPALMAGSSAGDPNRAISSMPSWYGVPILGGADADTDIGDPGHIEVINALSMQRIVVVDVGCVDLMSGRGEALRNQIGQVIAVARPRVTDAAKVAALVRTCGAPVHLAARVARADTMAPWDLSNAYGCRVATVIRDVRGLPKAVDCGVGPSMAKPRWNAGRSATPRGATPEHAAASLARMVRGEAP
ncbi:hypothetical protein [Rarobacter incanus]|uniref:Secretion/DNA translocation related CpaE-like protein n=1 Tax=Rarobacter incanus TaxID=153494 RepID=A0A542SPA9_9MICO|nr:hypothetical protein [Rarobacter incanus]TQK76422.1 hypothetical protein FB389_1093 [Rarobacter incanus]